MIVSPLIRIAALIAAHSLPETNLLFNQLFTEKKDLLCFPIKCGGNRTKNFRKVFFNSAAIALLLRFCLD